MIIINRDKIMPAAQVLVTFVTMVQIKAARSSRVADRRLRKRFEEKGGDPTLNEHEWGAAKMAALMLLGGIGEKLGIDS